jgi:hypothetical protein
MAKLTFTIPVGSRAILIATDYSTAGELVSIWSADGTVVGRLLQQQLPA